MKIEFTKEWCLRMAELEIETGIDFVIGAPPPSSLGTSEPDQTPTQTLDTNVAFGRFVQLMRRSRSLSIERLAEITNVDISELVEIEEDAHHLPEPRTVFNLANFFKVPLNRLMQLSRLAAANDERLIDEAMRFAARSEPTRDLTKEERAALMAFVSVLSER